MPECANWQSSLIESQVCLGSNPSSGTNALVRKLAKRPDLDSGELIVGSTPTESTK